MRHAFVVLASLLLAGMSASRQAPTPPGTTASAAVADTFSHKSHAKLFPSCTGCHAGVTDPNVSPYPSSASCETCHDGTIDDEVKWSPPTSLPRTNLRFDHTRHLAADTATLAGGESACVGCHTPSGSAWMSVRFAAIERCLDCHGVRTPHLAAPDSACSTCHLPLVAAIRLERSDIAAFPKPPSHEEAGFAGARGHGDLARAAPAAPSEVSASCAVCHARDYCVECHVDAPEQPTIQALGSDPRSLALEAHLEAPPDHADGGFLAGHGAEVRKSVASCRTCHTRESCETCHIGTPEVARGLFAAARGRGHGAVTERKPPPSHLGGFQLDHATLATAAPETCAGCHVRSDCLDCHRSDAASGSPGFHPADFLSRHPVAAYTRETSCSDCHNPSQFCQSCHASSGLVATGELRPGFHDSNPSFIAGHGQAARQNLESCVSCHAERDCLACHSAQSGRRFNPHGPGFDAERLRKRNAEMCSACHGAAIPGAP